MNQLVCRIALAAVALASLAASARAVVVVAEDFFYNEPTKAVANLAGFTGAKLRRRPERPAASGTIAGPPSAA